MILTGYGDPIYARNELKALDRLDPFWAPARCKTCGEEIEWTIDGQVFDKSCKCEGSKL